MRAFAAAIACALGVSCTGASGDSADTALAAGPHYALGGWPIDACSADVAGTGFAEGDTAEDLHFPDQYGEDVTLHDFCDHVVYIVFSAVWDDTSQTRAAYLESDYQQRVDAGGMILQAIVQDADRHTPDTDTLAAWADTYGLTLPVVGDRNYAINDFADGSAYGLPYAVLIDRGMRIDTVGYATLSQMDALLGG